MSSWSAIELRVSTIIAYARSMGDGYFHTMPSEESVAIDVYLKGNWKIDTFNEAEAELLYEHLHRLVSERQLELVETQEPYDASFGVG